jgi:hypothetical protein
MSSESKADTDDLLIRFLLDEMSKEERVQIENRFLADNEFFEGLLAAESALLDQYAQGKLSGHRLRQAQSLFESSSSQKREVEFTKELIAAVHESHVANDLVAAASVAPGRLQAPVPVSNVTRFGWALALLICISLLIWAAFLYSSRRSLEAQRLAAERNAEEAQRKLNEQLEADGELNKQLQAEVERRTQAEELLAQMQTRQPPEITSILLFSAANPRGGQGDGIAKFKPGSRLVQIHLYLDEPETYKRYSVKIRTVGNREIWKNDSIGADRIRNDRLSLLLPRQLFEHEDYKIELKGQAADGSFVYVADYTFKVRK